MVTFLAAQMPLEALAETVLIPAGEFLMGAAEGEEDERPVHPVMLDAYHIAIHPVTVGQYARFLRETGHRPPAIYELPLIVASGGRDREQAFRTDAAPYTWRDGQPDPSRLEHPVALVRWEDAAAYCSWLSAITGKPARLPTEAEWERAARGGHDGQRYPWGDDIDHARANYLRDPLDRGRGGTTPVRRYPPNGFGLYDTIGNVWEWVLDWYQRDVYWQGPRRNPRGPANGTMRVVRGGGWLTSDPRMLTCSYRHKVPPDTYSYSIGFRIAYTAGA
jgi:formylglycine-generating enzyme required for sulfatase activity